MGRKIAMKKIEDVTRCQVTFSKRRSSVMKKAEQVSVCCDIDIAFVAFSPSGRISKFCNQKRIEDVLFRYINLPANQRMNHISNVQKKMEKLRQLGHIDDDTSKIQYLDKQIENLELQIKKSNLELQIAETDLRDYELDAEQGPTLHQLIWCERNLHHSLEKTIARKNDLAGKAAASAPHKMQLNEKMDDQMESESRGGIIQQFPSNLNDNEQIPAMENNVNPFARQILLKLDPRTNISPYCSGRVSESMFHDMSAYSKNEKPGPSNKPADFWIPTNYQMLDFMPEVMLTSDHAEFPSPHIPIDQQSMPLLVGQPLLNHQQANVDAYTSSVFYSGDRIHMPSQVSRNIQLNMDYWNNSFNNGKARIGDTGDEDYGNKTQFQAPYYVHQPKEVSHVDNFRQEGILGEDVASTSDVIKKKRKMKDGGSCDWEKYLILDENLNFQEMFTGK